MTNEQRAHDLAILATNVLVQNPRISESNYIHDENGTKIIDIYEIYTDSYNKLLNSFNRDFPNT